MPGLLEGNVNIDQLIRSSNSFTSWAGQRASEYIKERTTSQTYPSLDILERSNPEYRLRDYQRPKHIVPKRGVRHRQRRLESPSLETAIEDSRRLLELKDNWDEEGSPGYTELTWRRATDFIRNTAFLYRKTVGSWVVPPRILPGPEGSIDIHWKSPSRELLINIPANEDAPAGYYGSGGIKDTVKGKLDTSSQNLWILMWLLR